ncbi:MAG: DUF3488 domain-containing protein [Sulfuritalea sp.]|jgi:hypothetical protein|nr:DUF3488 domain-containing protein [Sulfuritalea sp.]
MIHAPREFDERPSFTPPDRLTRLALGYLALPVFLYFPGWFQPAPALILALLLGYACWRALSAHKLASTPWPPNRLIALALLVATVWSVFGGAGHFFYANAHDWIIRDAILRDLVVAPWPPNYSAGGDELYLLRAPVAYFLPAAAIAKLTGLATADKLLWLWTVIGITVFFLLLPLRHTTLIRSTAALLIVVLFSGMDIAGYMFPDFYWGNVPLPGAFIDWWIKPPPLVSYWSNTSNLFWNPNHSLPAWISIALFYRHWRHPRFLAITPLLVAVLPLWSPFALIGIAPFLAMQTLRWWRKHPRHSLDMQVIAACVAVFGVIFVTLTIPFSGIHYGMTLTTAPGGWIYLNDFSHVSTYLENYTLFVIFEFAVIALLVSRAVDRWLFVTAVLTLLVLPLFSFGPGNDLAMRGSIPSLGILCIAAVNAFAHPTPGTGPYRRWLLGLVLAIGAVTPYYEFTRAVIRKPWAPNLDFTLIDADNGQIAPHYLVSRRRSPMDAALNTSAPLPNAVDWLYFCDRIHPRNKANKAHVAFAWRNNRNDEEIRIKRERIKLDCMSDTSAADPKANPESEPRCP